MFSLNLHLTIAVRTMDDGGELEAPIGWPEISCIGETRVGWVRGLTGKAADLVLAGAASPLTFHRRLAAPKRRADWQEPVDLQFQCWLSASK